MSQIILDEQLNWRLALEPMRRWITVQKIEDMRPYETIKDDRVPQILWGLKRPTFVTIDAGLYDKRNRDRRYRESCIYWQRHFRLLSDQLHLADAVARNEAINC